MGSALNLAVVAGEPSGDTHAGHLVRAFADLAPGTRWFGAGGPTLAAAGTEILVPMERLAVVGIGEVLSRLPDLWRAMGAMKAALASRRPDALVLVDFPDFNFRLARHAHSLGIPVVYYITPQVWAWRQGRTEFLKKYVDLALVIFPFEERFLSERGVRAAFVGHPLVDTARPDTPLAAFLARHGLSPETPRVALLPGSRSQEVRRNLPPLMEAAAILGGRRPAPAILVPWADGLPEGLRARYEGSGVRWIAGEYRDVLGHAQAAAVASGTATLEAALLGVPFVVVYRVQPLTYLLGRRLVKLPHVGLPNVVMGRGMVPELIQEDFTGPRVAGELAAILDRGTGAAEAARELSSALKNELGEGNASARAARAVFQFVSDRQRAF